MGINFIVTNMKLPMLKIGSRNGQNKVASARAYFK